MEVVFITLSHMWHLPQSSPGRKVARRGGSAVETRESTARRGGAGRVGVAEPGLSLYHWQAEGWGGSKPPEPVAGGGGCRCGGPLAEASKGVGRMGQRRGRQAVSAAVQKPELQMSCLCVTCILASFP